MKIEAKCIIYNQKQQPFYTLIKFIILGVKIQIKAQDSCNKRTAVCERANSYRPSG